MSEAGLVWEGDSLVWEGDSLIWESTAEPDKLGEILMVKVDRARNLTVKADRARILKVKSSRWRRRAT